MAKKFIDLFNSLPEERKERIRQMSREYEKQLREAAKNKKNKNES